MEQVLLIVARHTFPDFELLSRLSLLSHGWKEHMQSLCARTSIREDFLTRSTASLFLLMKKRLLLRGKGALPKVPKEASSQLLLGRMVGRGGFCTVFELGKISTLCVKVAHGGMSTEGACSCDVSQEERIAHAQNWFFPCMYSIKVPDFGYDSGPAEHVDHSLDCFTRAYFAWSSTYVAQLLSRRQVDGIVLGEFELMVSRTFQGALPEFLGTDSTAAIAGGADPLYPRVFSLCLVGSRLAYVMERIHGETLRQLLRNSASEESRAQCTRVNVSAPLALLAKEMKRHPHGDLKPENVILQRDGRFRLIDPSASSRLLYVDPQRHNRVMEFSSKSYHPRISASLGDSDADLVSLMLIIIECISGESLMRRLENPLENFDDTRRTRMDLFESSRESLKARFSHSLIEALFGLMETTRSYSSQQGEHPELTDALVYFLENNDPVFLWQQNEPLE